MNESLHLEKSNNAIKSAEKFASKVVLPVARTIRLAGHLTSSSLAEARRTEECVKDLHVHL